METSSNPPPLSWKAPVDCAEHELEWTLDRFDMTDHEELSLVPLKSTETWEALPALAALRPGMLIAGIFKPMMQLERSFSAALTRVHLPALCLPPERIGVLPLLSKELPLAAVVSLWMDHIELPPLPENSQIKDLCHHRVLGVHERPERYDLPLTSFEMHLVPGLVLLLQCGAVAGKNIFHPSERFTWEFKGDAAFVTDGGPERRFTGVPLPGGMRARDSSCSCGRRMQLTLL